jgi:hypothetical protein
MEDVQLAGLALAKMILAACVFGAAIFVGVKVADRSSRLWGWLSGLMTFAIVGVLFASAIAAIDQKTCQMDELAEECD